MSTALVENLTAVAGFTNSRALPLRKPDDEFAPQLEVSLSKALFTSSAALHSMDILLVSIFSHFTT